MQTVMQETSAVPCVCLLVTRVRHGHVGSISAEDMMCVFWLPGSDVDSLDPLHISAEDLSSSWCVSFGYQGQTWTGWICQCRRPQQFMVCVFWLPGSDMDSLGLSAQAAVQKTPAVPRSVPPHLLMTSILEQVCHSYVRDTAKAEQLFKGVLSGVGLNWTSVTCAGAGRHCNI